MNHQQLIKEAEELAKDKKQAELARLGFVYAYVANHELRLALGRLGNLEKVVWGLGVSMMLGLVSIIVKLFSS